MRCGRYVYLWMRRSLGINNLGFLDFELDAVDAVDFVFAGALGDIDGVGAYAIEEIELADDLGHLEDALAVDVAHPMILVIAEEEGAEEGAGVADRAVDLDHEGKASLVEGGGIDLEGDDEVEAVVGVGSLDTERLGLEAEPFGIVERVGVVDEDVFATGAEKDEGQEGEDYLFHLVELD